MPGPSWGEDSAAGEALIATNVVAVLRTLLLSAGQRVTPTLGVAQQWHRDIFQGVSSPPKPTYLGTFRGSADHDLRDYEVHVIDQRNGRILSSGADPDQVAEQLVVFGSASQTSVTTLDGVIAVGQQPADSRQLLAVVELAAVVHGEWVRIHPFANGNGRVARTWANWVAVRYGLPPFVRIKPRPDGLLYGQAAHESMGALPATQPDHRLSVQVFLDLLRERP